MDVDLDSPYRIIPAHQIASVSPHQPSRSHKPNDLDHLLECLETLERENHQLRLASAEQSLTLTSPPILQYMWRTLHCVAGDTFLDPPQWTKGERRPVLHSARPLQNVDFYLDQHPELAFVFFREYNDRPPADMSLIMTKDGVYRNPEPFKETLALLSEHIISAIKQVQRQLPGIPNVFPQFDPGDEIPAPYLFFYYSLPLLENVQLGLTPVEKSLLSQLTNSIQASRCEEYPDAKICTNRGTVSNKLMKYLIKPGHVLVRT